LEDLATIAPRVLNSAALSAESQFACETEPDRRRHALWLPTIQPGQTRTIPVTITPAGKPGTLVSGSLFVDDLTFVNVLGQLPAADELSAIPYKYTIG
jgi:hypothetical protein